MKETPETWQMADVGKEVSLVMVQVADDGGSDPQGVCNDGVSPLHRGFAVT